MRVGSRGIEYTGHVRSGVFRKSVRDERACTIVKSTSGPERAGGKAETEDRPRIIGQDLSTLSGRRDR